MLKNEYLPWQKARNDKLELIMRMRFLALLCTARSISAMFALFSLFAPLPNLPP